jgi:hypothetical protein
VCEGEITKRRKDGLEDMSISPRNDVWPSELGKDASGHESSMGAMSGGRTALGSGGRNTVRGPGTREEARRLLARIWSGQRRSGRCTRSAAVRASS